ncbi:transposase [Pseudomonas toyotomiensis]|nr:transposase [Pseudomonas toyotomiensis]HCF6385798.1 transposase [Pseudomonas aeruginosa]
MDLYEIWCAVLYLLKTGCQWRLIPSDFPRWQTVSRYFKQWSAALLVQKSVGGCGKTAGTNSTPACSSSTWPFGLSRPTTRKIVNRLLHPKFQIELVAYGAKHQQDA